MEEIDEAHIHTAFGCSGSLILFLVPFFGCCYGCSLELKRVWLSTGDLIH